MTTEQPFKKRAESGRPPYTEQLESGTFSSTQNNSQIGISVSVPCMPGRTQRVLINKRQSAKSTTTA